MAQAFTLLFGLVGVIALAKKAVDLVTWATNGQWDAIVKTLAAIGAAIGFTFWLASTDIPVSFTIDGTAYTLGNLNNATVAYAGLALGAVAAFGVDFLAAIDNTRSSATGPLIGGGQPEG